MPGARRVACEMRGQFEPCRSPGCQFVCTWYVGYCCKMCMQHSGKHGKFCNKLSRKQGWEWRLWLGLDSDDIEENADANAPAYAHTQPNAQTNADPDHSQLAQTKDYAEPCADPPPVSQSSVPCDRPRPTHRPLPRLIQAPGPAPTPPPTHSPNPPQKQCPLPLPGPMAVLVAPLQCQNPGCPLHRSCLQSN